MQNEIDIFYPMSATMQSSGFVWEIQMILKLEDHLRAAMAGDRERESKLINRLGQIRRNIPHFSDLLDNLQDVIKRSVEWLRSIGRKVDFQHPNPAMWISARDGKSPRW